MDTNLCFSPVEDIDTRSCFPNSMVEPTQFQSSDDFDSFNSDASRSDNPEDWTLLKEFWSFRDPLENPSNGVSRQEKNSRDLEDDGYCSIRPVADDADKDPMLCADRRSAQPTSSPALVTAQSETFSDSRPLPSITTLVRGPPESSLYTPSLGKGDYLQIPNRDNNLVFSEKSDFNPSERSSFSGDSPCGRSLDSCKPARFNQVAAESRNFPSTTPAPVDLSSLSSKEFLRQDDFSLYPEDRPSYLQYRSPRAPDPETPEFTPEYVHDYPSSTPYEKLQLLKSPSEFSEDSLLKSNNDYKKDLGSEFDAPYTNFKSLSLLAKDPECGASKAPRKILSVPSNSSFVSPTSPGDSLGPSGDSSNSPRPPVSLLRDLLVLGKPPVTSSPPAQHEQVCVF